MSTQLPTIPSPRDKGGPKGDQGAGTIASVPSLPQPRSSPRHGGSIFTVSLRKAYKGAVQRHEDALRGAVVAHPSSANYCDEPNEEEDKDDGATITTTGTGDPFSSVHYHGSLTRWPSPQTQKVDPTGELDLVSTNQPSLAAKLEDLIRKHRDRLAMVEAAHPPLPSSSATSTSLPHKPQHSSTFALHLELCRNVCTVMGTHFRPYKHIFSAVVGATEGMGSIYSKLQGSVDAIQSNGDKIDKEHSTSMAALKQTITALQSEVARLSDTEKALITIATLEEDKANLSVKAEEAEKRYRKTKASLSELHERYSMLQHRLVLVTGSDERGKIKIAQYEADLKEFEGRVSLLDFEKGELQRTGDKLEGELNESKKRASRLDQQVNVFEEKHAKQLEEISLLKYERAKMQRAGAGGYAAVAAAKEGAEPRVAPAIPNSPPGGAARPSLDTTHQPTKASPTDGCPPTSAAPTLAAPRNLNTLVVEGTADIREAMKADAAALIKDTNTLLATRGGSSPLDSSVVALMARLADLQQFHSAFGSVGFIGQKAAAEAQLNALKVELQLVMERSNEIVQPPDVHSPLNVTSHGLTRKPSSLPSHHGSDQPPTGKTGPTGFPGAIVQSRVSTAEPTLNSPTNTAPSKPGSATADIPKIVPSPPAEKERKPPATPSSPHALKVAAAPRKRSFSAPMQGLHGQGGSPNFISHLFWSPRGATIAAGAVGRHRASSPNSPLAQPSAVSAPATILVANKVAGLIAALQEGRLAAALSQQLYAQWQQQRRALARAIRAAKGTSKSPRPVATPNPFYCAPDSLPLVPLIIDEQVATQLLSVLHNNPAADLPPPPTLDPTSSQPHPQQVMPVVSAPTVDDIVTNVQKSIYRYKLLGEAIVERRIVEVPANVASTGPATTPTATPSSRRNAATRADGPDPVTEAYASKSDFNHITDAAKEVEKTVRATYTQKAVPQPALPTSPKVTPNKKGNVVSEIPDAAAESDFKLYSQSLHRQSTSLAALTASPTLEYGAVFLPAATLNDVYEACYDFVAALHRLSANSKGTVKYLNPSAMASALIPMPAASGLQLGSQTAKVMAASDSTATNADTAATEGSNCLLDSSFADDFVACVATTVLPKLKAIVAACQTQDEVAAAVALFAINGDASASKSQALPAPTRDAKPLPPKGSISAQPPSATKGKSIVGSPRAGDLQLATSTNAMFYSPLKGTPTDGNMLQSTPIGHQQPDRRSTTGKSQLPTAEDPIDSMAVCNITLEGLLYSIVFHSLRMQHRLPAARMFLCHLHNSVPKTFFLLVRKQVDGVRTKMATLTRHSMVVAVTLPLVESPEGLATYKAHHAATLADTKGPTQPTPQAGTAPVPQAPKAQLLSLTDLTAALTDDFPMYLDGHFRMLHEALMADPTLVAAMLEGTGLQHYLSNSDVGANGNAGGAQAPGNPKSGMFSAVVDTLVPRSARGAGSPTSAQDDGNSEDSSCAIIATPIDPLCQVSNGVLRHTQCLQYGLMATIAKGGMRLRQDAVIRAAAGHCSPSEGVAAMEPYQPSLSEPSVAGASNQLPYITSIRSNVQDPMSGFTQVLVALALQHQLWGTCAIQAAIRDVVTMVCGGGRHASRAGASGGSLTKPSHFYTSEAVSVQNIQQAMERADPVGAARAGDVMRRFVIELCCGNSNTDLPPRQRVVVRDIVSRIPLLPYHRLTPILFGTSSQEGQQADQPEGAKRNLSFVGAIESAPQAGSTSKQKDTSPPGSSGGGSRTFAVGKFATHTAALKHFAANASAAYGDAMVGAVPSSIGKDVQLRFVGISSNAV